ncbi:MAG: GNAT family N-acetyltransferase [Anaerolineales bacterium]|nr:GNAT family N-acetyltransferase [Anaerolineales bacterium]
MNQYETDVALKDGSLVHIRPVVTTDQQLLLDFIQNLSPETYQLRFPRTVISDNALGQLLHEDNRFCLIALRDDRVIGHASYMISEVKKADIGLVVMDEYQGKGLGTILLGQLIQAAAEEGVELFDTLVPSENAPLLRVLRGLGFPTELKIAQGLIHVIFPASNLPEALERFEKREAASAAAAMKKFFNPRGIAVIGASRDRGSISGELFHNILEAGFQGPVYPVNAKTDVVQSVAAYRSVLDCPGKVDLAFIVVPAPAVLAVARECAQKGVSALVVISAGFSEAGEAGVALQEELVRICREAGMRLIGPNCMGIINTDPAVSLNGQFSPFAPIEGKIGFLSQSGALGIAVIEYATRLGLGMSSFVSVGNKADISGNDLVQYWESDPNTDLILLYLESFGNPRKFSRIARQVSRKKPIIAVKGGRGAAGFRATQSHTGALVASSDINVDALFRQAGVIRTDVLAEMFDVAAFLTTQPVPKGNRAAIITNAGGAGILAADACEDLGLQVPEFTPETQEELKTYLSPAAGVKNPVDMVASAQALDYARVIEIVAQDPNVDALIVIFIPPMAVRPEEVAAEILNTAKKLQNKVPILSTFMASHGAQEILSDGEISIPAYPFPEAAARALSSAVQYGQWLQREDCCYPKFSDIRQEDAMAIVAQSLKDGERWLTQRETGMLLDCYGIPLVETLYASSPKEAGLAAEKLGRAIALKATGPGLVHKTEIGAVRLALVGREETEIAAEEMLSEVQSMGITGVEFILQPMVSSGIEMIVGVTHDPVFGPIVVCGAGGTMVELLKDVAVRITPLTDQDAGEMVRSLKTFPLLTGFRGEAHYDVAALEELILRISTLVEDIHEIAELDLNPVIVLPEGNGVSLVDARIRVAEALPPLPFGAKKRSFGK